MLKEIDLNNPANLYFITAEFMGKFPNETKTIEEMIILLKKIEKIVPGLNTKTAGVFNTIYKKTKKGVPEVSKKLYHATINHSKKVIDKVAQALGYTLKTIIKETTGFNPRTLIFIGLGLTLFMYFKK